ncbi:MAG TPA: AI-2E family transporter [Polyangiaceae bacterium]|nr:AI-2E family transporter [Polyangiaceae bacterium]
MSEQRVIHNLGLHAAMPTSAAREGSALRWLVGGLTLAAAAALVPFWAPLLLAAWGAIIAWPLQARLARLLRRPRLAAVLLTGLLVLVILLPVTVATLSVSSSAITLGQHLSESKNGAEALKALSSGEAAGFHPQQLDPQHVLDLVRQHGAAALGAVRSIFGAASVALLGLVVFVAGFFTFLTEGKRARDWLLERSPLSHAHFHRFGNVFAEAGRGLLIGVGLTALAQGAVATIGYLATGVPQALVLGLVTVFASLIPSVGSALVWVPVTAGLALTGRPGAAVVMLVVGLFVSVIDNLLRPWFARYAELRLHSLALFVAMLGGIVLFGAWGLLLGPLLVRWASEGLSMLREQREQRAAVGE